MCSFFFWPLNECIFEFDSEGIYITYLYYNDGECTQNYSNDNSTIDEDRETVVLNTCVSEGGDYSVIHIFIYVMKNGI